MPAPTIGMKGWAAVFDPVRPMHQPEIERLFAESVSHDKDFAIFECFPKARQFLDIGANCGQSISSFRAFNKTTSVISFEPNPLCFRILLKYGGTLPDVRAYPFGLSSEDAFLHLYTPAVDRLLLSAYASTRPELFGAGGQQEGAIARYSGGKPMYLFREKLAFMRGDDFDLAPDLIKVDAEGAESVVLQGLGRTIKEHRPLLMIEKMDAHTVSTYLSTLGYRPYRYGKTADGRHAMVETPITEQTPLPSIQLNVFYAHDSRIAEYRSANGIEVYRAV